MCRRRTMYGGRVKEERSIKKCEHESHIEQAWRQNRVKLELKLQGKEVREKSLTNSMGIGNLFIGCRTPHGVRGLK